MNPVPDGDVPPSASRVLSASRSRPLHRRRALGVFPSIVPHFTDLTSRPRGAEQRSQTFLRPASAATVPSVRAGIDAALYDPERGFYATEAPRAVAATS